MAMAIFNLENGEGGTLGRGGRRLAGRGGAVRARGRWTGTRTGAGLARQGAPAVVAMEGAALGVARHPGSGVADGR